MALRDDLVEQARAQVEANRVYRELIAGTGSLPTLSAQARTERFRRLLEWARVDIGEVIVEAVNERLAIVGFRTDPTTLEGDASVWELWQRERMPKRSQEVIQEALSVGDAYLVCERREDGTARLVPESSDFMVVQYEEGSRDDIAVAAKVWSDSGPYGSGMERLWVTLYDAEKIERWLWDGQWRSRGVDVNPLGFVPVTHLRNRPSLADRSGRSELWGLENDIGRVTKTSADLMLLSELSSFKVRYATGIDVPEDDNGEPVEPFKIGPDRLLVSENESAKFGTLDESSLDPSLNVVKAMVAQVAALSRTPLFYLSGDLVNMSGDSLRAMEGQLVAKVRQRQLQMEDPLAEAVRMALRVEGRAEADGPIEVIWQDPRSKSFGEVANGVTQLYSAGVIPQEQAWIELDYGPIEREQMRASVRRESLTQAALANVAALRRPQPQAVEAVVA